MTDVWLGATVEVADGKMTRLEVATVDREEAAGVEIEGVATTVVEAAPRS